MALTTTLPSGFSHPVCTCEHKHVDKTTHTCKHTHTYMCAHLHWILNNHWVTPNHCLCIQPSKSPLQQPLLSTPPPPPLPFPEYPPSVHTYIIMHPPPTPLHHLHKVAFVIRCSCTLTIRFSVRQGDTL